MAAEFTPEQRSRQKAFASSPQNEALTKWNAAAEREDAEIEKHGEVIARPSADQSQLFDTSRLRGPRAAEMLPEQWVQHHGNDIVYHGTFRGSDVWRAPTIHAGTQKAALERMRNVAGMIRVGGGESYYNPNFDDFSGGDDDALMPDVHEGHMLALRLSQDRTAPHEVPDMIANSGDLLHQAQTTDFDDISKSVRFSAGGLVQNLAERLSYDPDSVGLKSWRNLGGNGRQIVNTMRHLRAGRAVPYTNTGEDVGSRSWLLPGMHSASTWENDVVSDPKAHPMVRDFALRRIARGQDGRVGFDVDAATPQEATPVAHALDNSVRAVPRPLRGIRHSMRVNVDENY